ncbi:PREDICTED: T-cell surface glycoprotein CD1e, membrane-associated [Elephantulus edwardii]|uniref:T-cell surface glycoprotein CD1e, membrane-associated n=1 Tax=Elephantulus edwardii TaxID=28737 RepID=UPI0003F08F8B|nr:PREDICTED: T-cell surface glycoprotein CD1e, membrane-associated [Elephantulus edwardii]
MLFLLSLLCQGLLCPGDSTAVPQVTGLPHAAAEEPHAFHMLQSSSFVNNSWAYTQSSGWLDDLQTHHWDDVLGTIRFLRPWSGGNFSKEELKNLQALFQLYYHGFIREVQVFASQFQFEYPFELQISSGCSIRSGKGTESFLMGAYQGTDFLSFQGNSWQPSPGAGSRAQNVCRLLNNYRDIKELVQSLLFQTCPRFLAGLLKAGKADLERQVKPEAWASKGPAPDPSHVLLVCHVSGFYPKPVWVAWMRGAQEQPGTQKSDVMPNADGTWYLRVTLDVKTQETSGLYCRVKHSSLGGHDLIIRWDEYSVLLTLICVTVLVTLIMLIALQYWFQKQSSSHKVLDSHLPAPTMTVNTLGPRRSRHQLCSVKELWSKSIFLKKWITSLNQRQ